MSYYIQTENYTHFFGVCLKDSPITENLKLQIYLLQSTDTGDTGDSFQNAKKRNLLIQTLP